ncbi:MAG: insulinase family protein [Ferruginibacter sp.]|nr:insulinase family protein [Ferruginibacter sp.]
MIDRKIPPPIKDAIEYKLDLKPYEFYSLDNNVPVYSINAGEQDVLQVEMVFYAGNFFEEQKGIAAATNFMLKNGTAKHTAFELNEAFEYYGSYCSRSCFNETAVLSLHTLSKHITKLLPVMQEMLTDSIFPEEELATFKQNSKQRLKVNLQKAEFVAGRLIDSYLYGENHPYGTYTNMEDVDALTTDALKNFYKQHYLNGNCVIFVAGLIPVNMQQLLNDYFGKLSVGKPTGVIPAIKPIPAADKKYHIENDPTAVQGAVRIASHFPNRHHPDFKKAVVLNNVFGGFFGSRLMSNIREDKGYTYGIHSYFQNHITESAWVISTEAGKEVCDATIREIYKEMKKLREEKIDEEELLLVRNYMIGGILGELDGPFQIIAKWKNIILNNLDENYFHESINEIKTVTALDLQQLANKYLSPEHFYELVVY